jgi:PST family polysaccharide transporter
VTRIYSLLRKFPSFSTLSDQSMSNLFWLLLDRAIRMAGGVLVSVWVARTLGPEEFGLLNYVISLVAIFSVFSTLGLESVVVKRILSLRESDGPDSVLKAVCSTVLLRAIGSLLAIALIWLASKLMVFGGRAQLDLRLWVLIWISAGLFFQSFDSIRHHYEAGGDSRSYVLPQLTSFFLTSAGRIYLILHRASAEGFAFLIFLEALLSGIFLSVGFFSRLKEIGGMLPSKREMVLLMRESWPLALSSVATLVYTKIDGVMIGNWMGNSELGLYSAALKVSEVWYFVPTVFSTAFFPRLFLLFSNDRGAFEAKFQTLLRYLFLLSFGLSIVATIFSEEIMQFLFGVQFVTAAPVLTIHIWTSIFVFMGVASSQWYIMEGLNRLLFFRTAIGAILNVALNCVLIPRFGSRGAALATLFTQAVAALFADLAHPKSRRLYWIKISSIASSFSWLNPQRQK